MPEAKPTKSAKGVHTPAPPASTGQPDGDGQVVKKTLEAAK